MLKVNNIKKSITNGTNKTDILKGVTFQIEEGEMVAIMGPSGCGKSTLLGILAGLDRPNTGNIVLDNTDLYKLDSEELDNFRNEHIGVVFQNFGLVKELNVEDNILLPIIFSPDSEELDLDWLTDFLGIKQLVKRYPTQLSGGEQQRVAIARSLIADPNIIFADEPTGSLDKTNGENIMKLFRNIANLDTSLLIITHDKAVASVCDRVILMEDGMLL